MPAVHPRSRGEHDEQLRIVRVVHGSSPLARGTHVVPAGAAPLVRFIPARAGNTVWSARRFRWTSVHPRSRGEHQIPKFKRLTRTGSSPLARGTPVLLPLRPLVGRFIPARAGNTHVLGIEGDAKPVHPRSRGEHRAVARVGRSGAGSSPLARGTQANGARRPVPGRFIPARAGNTKGSATPSSRAPVHPRSRGEHSSWNLLISHAFFDDKARTNNSARIFKERETP